MSNTETTGTTEPAKLAEGIAASEVLHLHAGTVEKLAALGAASTGIDIVSVEYGSTLVGLPAEFPIAIIHGEQPKLVSLKSFAEEWRILPTFATGVAKVQTLGSFVALVNRHKNEETAVFADCNWKAPSFTAVIDYHHASRDGGVAANNGEHRVHYPFPLSDEWQAWIKGNGEPMSQLDFAAMIEDRIAELAAPDDAMKIWMERDFQTTIATPAQLITLSRGLQVYVDTKVKDFKTLQSGEGQIQFEETHKDSDGKPIKIPGLFVLSIAPFFMGEKIQIPVRLRYRVRAGQIVWFYQIYRPDEAINEAVGHAIADVRQKTGLPVYEGAPEMLATGKPVSGFGGA